MSLLKNRWLWMSALGVLLSGGLLLVVVGYLGLIVYSGLMTGTPIVTILLELALPTLLAVAVLLVLLAISLIGMLWVLVHNASLPRRDRFSSLAAWVEREYPPVRALGLSELLEPPEPSADERAEQALAELKQQYIDGEITEAEFERKVDRLVTNESIDEARATRERADARNKGREY